MNNNLKNECSNMATNKIVMMMKWDSSKTLQSLQIGAQVLDGIHEVHIIIKESKTKIPKIIQIIQTYK